MGFRRADQHPSPMRMLVSPDCVKPCSDLSSAGLRNSRRPPFRGQARRRQQHRIATRDREASMIGNTVKISTVFIAATLLYAFPFPLATAQTKPPPNPEV